ncbi:MAG: hypothetical protein ACI4AI_03080 [Paludibacteraceae bacterium]
MAEDGDTYNEVSHSMQRRCEGWDYKGRGIYMLTLVVRDRQPLLCTIEEDEKGLCAVSTEIGRAVLEETEHITKIYPQIRILCRQIMPDHLHLLLFVEEALPVHLTSVVSGFKLGCNRGYWNSLAKLANTEHRGEGVDTERINEVKIPLAKLANTEHRREEADTERRCGEENDKKQTAVSCAADLCEAEKKDTQARRTGLWADGYHDRILFHKGQLDALIHYIKDNPRRLALKRANPGLFKIRQHLQIAGMSFTAMGNIFFADYPQKAVIQCSRKLHQAEIDAKKAECLGEAAKGMVFVSAAISEGEKQICRAVREAGHPIMVLLEKGFPKPEDPNYKYFKPQGVYFEACAAGKLLLLEPEKELYEQAEIEAEVVAKAGNIPHEALRYRFLALNAIAERICGEETPATEVPGTEHR